MSWPPVAPPARPAPPPGPARPRPRHPARLVLPITSVVLVVVTGVVPFVVLQPMIHSYRGEAAAYGIHAFGVATVASVLCWVLAVVTVVVGVVSLALRQRLMGLPITAVTLAVLLAFAGPVAYLLIALSADAY